MNRSDLSEDDHNTSTNSTRGGNGADEVEEADYNSKYVPPKNVPIVEIWNKDSDDPSLNKYKQQLIGSAINIIIEPSDPSRLLLKRLVLIPEDHHGDIIFDLTSGSNLDKYKDYVVRLKENSTYRIKLEFFVQREIISGLKLLQTAYKGPLRTDKSSYMMGSRAPKPEIQEYLSEKETVPSGMMARGKYHMKSSITDDDKNVYAKWEWILEIGKDWKQIEIDLIFFKVQSIQIFKFVSSFI